MIAEKHIRHYNRLNGNQISTQKLNRFHQSIKRDIDAQRIDSHVPFGVELIAIEKRIAQVLKNAKGFSYLDIELKPVSLNKYKQSKIKNKKSKNNSACGKMVAETDAKRYQKGLFGFPDVYGLEKGLPKGESPGLGFTKDGQTKIYSMITDMVLKAMKQEKQLPWHKPWAIDSILATNLKSGKAYKGTNLFMLNLIAPMLFGKSGPYWLTYKQAQEMGGQVKKGAEAFPVIYYSIYYSVQKPVKKTITESQYKEMSEGERATRGALKLFTINYYNVFSQEDIEGIDFPTHGNRRGDATPIETAEAVVEGMPQRPEIINHSIGRAFYSPSDDHIKIPSLDYFKSDQEYYSTLFHELIHSTGHKSRLNRFSVNKEDAEGKDDYAFEELVAEMGASYLNAESGILYYTMNNSAVYLKGWQSKLENLMKEDNKFFLKASAKAAQAADFILDRVEQEVALSGKQDSIKAGSTVKINSGKGSNNKGLTDTPLFEKALKEKQTSFGSKKSLGFVSADQAPQKPTNTFTLPGEIGKLLGTLQRFKLEIIIAGETHSSKSQLGMQIANAFAEHGDTVAWLDWEQGGLTSKDTQDNITRNTKPENKKHIHVSPDVPRTLPAIKALTKHYKVIALDSGSKLGEVTNAWIDTLREEHPNTIWIIMMQQNVKGGTRGGSAAEFDAPVLLKTYRPDESTHENNYAYVFKNRGNKTGIFYLINKKKITAMDPSAKKVSKAPKPIAA